MSRETLGPTTPEEARARDALRALPRPAADPAFRARLRADFVSGRIGQRVTLALPQRRAIWAWVLGPVVAVFVAVAVPSANHGPAWRVATIEGSGMVVVDQRPVPAQRADDLRRALHPGARLSTVGPVTLELVSERSLMLQIASGTDLTLPEPPPRWFGRVTRAAVTSGEIRITSGPAFRGARLTVTTPEAHVEVTGTTLAVICEPAGTCVCVLEGAVMMGPSGGTMEPVPEGRRMFVFRDGRDPEHAGMRDTEVGALSEFRARHAGGAR